MKKQVFVYFNDGYPENGDIGLHVCETREQAETFITERMVADTDRNLSMYVIIEGIQLQPFTINVVTKIVLKE